MSPSMVFLTLIDRWNRKPIPFIDVAMAAKHELGDPVVGICPKTYKSDGLNQAELIKHLECECLKLVFRQKLLWTSKAGSPWHAQFILNNPTFSRPCLLGFDVMWIWCRTLVTNRDCCQCDRKTGQNDVCRGEVLKNLQDTHRNGVRY